MKTLPLVYRQMTNEQLALTASYLPRKIGNANSLLALIKRELRHRAKNLGITTDPDVNEHTELHSDLARTVIETLAPLPPKDAKDLLQNIYLAYHETERRNERTTTEICN